MLNSFKWQLLIAAAGLGGIILLLQALAVPVVARSVPATGGTFVEGVVGIPLVINPLLASSDVDRDISSLVFSGLTKTNAQGQVAPDLAESWKMSEDGRSWTFKLRRNVTWHDGAPFSADDVVFTLSLIKHPDFEGDAGLAQLWRGVEIEKVNDHEVTLTLEQPYAPFLHFTNIGILPEHLLGGVPAGELSGDRFSMEPVGTGPFRLDPEGLGSQSVSLIANRDYYGEGPYMNGIRFQSYPDFETAIAALKEGEVQAVGNLPPGQAFRLRDDQSINIYSADLSSFGILLFNLRLYVFEDKLVRQAIAYGIDRDYLVEKLLYGQGTVADSPILPASWAYKKDIKRYEFNPMKARGLLEEAGWIDRDGDGIREKDGRKLKFTIITNDQPERMALATEIAGQLKGLGMHVNVESKEAGRLVAENLVEREFEAVLFGWRTVAGDPDCYQMWHSTQASTGYNFSGFENTPADRQLEQARRALQQSERAELYRQFQDIFAEEMPSLLLYYPVYNYAVSKSVGGVKLADMSVPSDRFRSIQSWYASTNQVLVEMRHGRELQR